MKKDSLKWIAGAALALAVLLTVGIYKLSNNSGPLGTVINPTKITSSTLAAAGAAGTAGANNFTGINVFGNDTSMSSGSIYYASPLGYTLANATSAYLYYQNLCNTLTAAAGGPVVIQLPTQNIASSSWGNGTLVLTNRCTYIGAKGGGTVWNGATVANVPIVQFSVAPTPHIAGGGIIGVTLNCTFPTVSTSSPSIGLMAGSSTNAGGAHMQIEWNTITGCGYGVVLGAGTYNTDVGFNSIVGNARNFYSKTANNATEGNIVHDNWIADAPNNNCNDSVYFDSSGSDVTYYTNNTTDNAGVHMLNGVTVFASNNKTEDSGGICPSYIPWIQDASQFSFLSLHGEKVFYSGNTVTSTYTALFDLSAQFDIQDVVIDFTTSTNKIANVFQSSGSTTNRSGQICSFSINPFNGQGITQFSAAWSNTSTFQGCYTVVGAGTPSILSASSTGSYSITTSRLDITGGLMTNGSSTLGNTLNPSTSSAVTNIGGSANNTYFVNISGGRGMLGFDTAFSTPSLVLSGGNGKGVAIVTNCTTSGVFQVGCTNALVFNSTGTGIFAGAFGVATSSATSVSSCGTNPTSTGSNLVANITLGTGGITACTYNFSPKWINPPVCIPSDSSSTDSVEINSVSTSSVTLGFNLSIGGGTAYLHCIGNPN